MTQLEKLKELATKGVEFWFISETQVGTRMPGSELVSGVAGMLNEEEKNHLKRQVVTFKAAEFKTHDPILAFAVLNSSRLDAMPAKWELPPEPAPPPPEPKAVKVPQSDAEVAAAKKARAAAKKARALADAQAQTGTATEGAPPPGEDVYVGGQPTVDAVQPEPDPVVEAAPVEPEPEPGPKFPNSSPKRRARR